MILEGFLLVHRIRQFVIFFLSCGTPRDAVRCNFVRSFHKGEKIKISQQKNFFKGFFKSYILVFVLSLLFLMCERRIIEFHTNLGELGRKMEA